MYIGIERTSFLDQIDLLKLKKYAFVINSEIFFLENTFPYYLVIYIYTFTILFYVATTHIPQKTTQYSKKEQKKKLNKRTKLHINTTSKKNSKPGYLTQPDLALNRTPNPKL